MSPAEAVARVARPERADRASEGAARGSRPALRSADAPTTRRSRLLATLSQPNLLGRIGTLAVGALFLSIFGVVVFQALLVQGQARLDHLNSQIATQQQDAQQLQAQVAQLESPSRIVTYAHDNLHMVDPGNVVYLQQTPTDASASALAPSTTPTTSSAAAPTTVPATPAKAATTPTTPATSATSARPASTSTVAPAPGSTRP